MNLSRRLEHSSRLLLLLALFASTPAVAWAQTETGRVTGVVRDQTGAALPGATVALTSSGTGSVRTSTSDTLGRYVFANVSPGPYVVKVTLSGFTQQTAALVVSVGGAVSVETTLRLAGQTETVTVVAESSVVNITNGELSSTINEKQIRELPTITRNAYDLVGIAPNVSLDSASNRGTGYAINGMRSASTNVLLDGSANNDEFTATIGQSVPLDAVQEFSIIRSNFSAQYGRASGGIVNLATKSGTNTLLGTGYEFFRSDELAANTVTNKANSLPKGNFTRNQLGYSIGGPVVKDRFHFFSSLEYIPVRSSDTEISWVPTPQFIAASDAATQAFFTAFGRGATINGPVLTRADVSALIGTGTGAFSLLPATTPIFGRVQKTLPIDAGGGDPGDEYQFVGRADWTVGAGSQAYVRYAYQNVKTQPGTNASSPYNGYDTGLTVNNHNILGSFTHVFSSTLTGQTKLVFNQVANDQPLNGDSQPTLYMNPTTAVRLQGYRIAFPGYLPWSPGNAIPFGGPQKLLQVYQDQTWLRGRHDLRFGGSYVRIADDRTFGAFANAVQSLNTTSNALTSLDNFVLGQIRRFQTAINPQGYPGGTYTTPVRLPSFLSENRYNEFALYISDDINIARRVKVNLGVRYEYYGPQEKSSPKYDSNFYYRDANASVNTSTPAQIVAAIRDGSVQPSNQSAIGSLWKPDKNDFAPRIGFAWDVRGDGTMSARGGYGIGYERNFGNVTYNVLFNPPQYLVASIDAPTDVATLPIYTGNDGPFGGVAGVTKTIPGGSLRHVDQNIETAFSHFYGASFEQKIVGGMRFAVEYSGSSGRKLYDLADVNKPGAPLILLGSGTPTARPNPLFTAFNTRANRGRSQYHSVSLSLDGQQIAKTGLQFSANYTLSEAKDNLSSTFSDSGNNFNLGYLDAFNPMLDWGHAEFDVRHRVSLSAIWEIPYMRDATGLRRTLLGGWQINSIFNARTGYPFTLWDCTNGAFYCMRAIDTVGIDKNATGSTPTGNPNEYTLLDLARIMGTAGSYLNPLTGNSDWGPYPATMTARDAFRGPGAWNMDLAMSKRFRFGARNAIQFRLEAYNVFNHANMFANTGNADISSFNTITGFRDGNRRTQLGFKFEF
jgi:Carboxypeptidase regulatory-like domain/TonB-dependent Receptor Plug Domain/TonB dependent receptor